MTINLEEYTEIRSIEPRHAKSGGLTLRANNDDAIGIHIFNRSPAETDSAALKRCSLNLAESANNAPGSAIYPEATNSATIQDNYWRMREDNILQTNIRPTTEIYGLVYGRCRSSSIGSTSAHRGFVIGNYGNSSEDGWGLYFNSVDQMRLLTYDGTETLKTVTYSYSNQTDLKEFGLFEYYISDAEIYLNDLSHSGAAQTQSLTNGHKVGSQDVTLFGRATLGTDYNESMHKDVCFSILLDAIPDAAGRAALIAQSRMLIAETGLVERN